MTGERRTDETGEARIVGAVPRAHARDCRCRACVRLFAIFDRENRDIEAVRRRLYDRQAPRRSDGTEA